jgi:hypothetical protein
MFCLPNSSCFITKWGFSLTITSHTEFTKGERKKKYDPPKGAQERKIFFFFFHGLPLIAFTHTTPINHDDMLRHFRKLSTITIFLRATDQPKKATLNGTTLVRQTLFQGKRKPSW